MSIFVLNLFLPVCFASVKNQLFCLASAQQPQVEGSVFQVVGRAVEVENQVKDEEVVEGQEPFQHVAAWEKAGHFARQLANVGHDGHDSHVIQIALFENVTLSVATIHDRPF